ncbi:MAG TPA: glycosyltransferase family 4 protein [Vicinamibacterales bacterium]|nr:glycosyltransferase family 4 protein [Vicinamibacterales bacterium]
MTGRLLILTLYYPPDLSACAFRAGALVQALREHSGGLAIDVITSMPSRYQTFTARAAEREADGPLTVRRLPLPPHRGDMRSQALSYARFARSAARVASEQQYDLVLATSSRLMTASLGAWVSRQSGAPLYLDIRDLFVDTMNEVLPARVAPLLRPALSTIERWTFRRAAKVNLVSPGFEPYVRRRYPQTPLSFFTNGIDDEFMAPAPAPASSAGHDGPITVVYAGNMGDGQGLHLIVPTLAASLDGRAQFRLIGDGGRRVQLADALKEAGVTNVTLLPPMSRTDLIAEYRGADVLFLHLNDYDAFTRVLPSKVFEYAALGKPVWAGVGGFAADFIRREVTNAAVFPPCDAAAALRALDTLALESAPREDFVRQFARRGIMQRMAEDIAAHVPQAPPARKAGFYR